MRLKPELIQIAGVHDLPEAEMLLRSGVDWLGLPLRLAVHKEDLTESEAADIVQAFKPLNCFVLITYLDQGKQIADFCRRLGVDKAQLHGDISPDELQVLRKLSPDLFVLKSLIVKQSNTHELRRTVDTLAPLVDAFITDTFDPETGACGATGKPHDWEVSKELVRLSPKPVILAGGLTPENVGRAIGTVRPAGVDAHTGVEDKSGRKSRDMVKAFVEEARKAFADSLRSLR